MFDITLYNSNFKHRDGSKIVKCHKDNFQNTRTVYIITLYFPYKLWCYLYLYYKYNVTKLNTKINDNTNYEKNKNHKIKNDVYFA